MLIYSAYTDGVLAAAAVVAEADAIVSKNGSGSELCAAIRSVVRGQRRLPPLPRRLAETLRRHLDHEEQAVFGLLLAGIEPAEVAETLGMSAAGMDSRLWRMLRRLEGLHSEPASVHRDAAATRHGPLGGLGDRGLNPCPGRELRGSPGDPARAKP